MIKKTYPSLLFIAFLGVAVALYFLAHSILTQAQQEPTVGIQETTSNLFQISVEAPDIIEPGNEFLTFITISQTGETAPAALEYKITNPKGEIVLHKTEPLLLTESFSLTATLTLPEKSLPGQYKIDVILNLVDKKAAASTTFTVLGKEPSKTLYLLVGLIFILALILYLIHLSHKPKNNQTLEMAKKTLDLIQEGKIEEAHRLAKKTRTNYQRLSRAKKHELHHEYKKLAVEMRKNVEALKSYHTQRRKGEHFKKELYDTTKKELEKMRRKKR